MKRLLLVVLLSSSSAKHHHSSEKKEATVAAARAQPNSREFARLAGCPATCPGLTHRVVIQAWHLAGADWSRSFLSDLHHLCGKVEAHPCHLANSCACCIGSSVR